jgi:hypothetical protein
MYGRGMYKLQDEICRAMVNRFIRLDALILGPRETIHLDQIPREQRFVNKEFKRFKLRPPWVVQHAEQRKEVQDKLHSIAKNLELGLLSGHNRLQNSLPNNVGFLGKTQYNINYFDKTKIIVAMEMVEPLLRKDLNPAERAVDTFRLASIIAHETAVRHSPEN